MRLLAITAVLAGAVIIGRLLGRLFDRYNDWRKARWHGEG